MSIKKHIPNAITSLNLIFGVIGIIALFEPELHAIAYFPFLCMLTAVLFDFCDGLAARLLGAYSPLGKELDSLADMVSFGVLPALMMYFNCSIWAAGGIAVFFAWIPLLIAVFSAVRLAKFNLDERQHSSFIGLPTPASALICGSLCCLLGDLPDSFGTAIPYRSRHRHQDAALCASEHIVHHHSAGYTLRSPLARNNFGHLPGLYPGKCPVQIAGS